LTRSRLICEQDCGFSAKDTIPRKDPSLATLIKLNEQGVLEPNVLLSCADEGIARDYAGYQKAHRDQLSVANNP